MRCISPVNIRNPDWDGIRNQYIAVPCGICSACLSNKRRQWTFRLENEVATSTSGYFITLTYNNENCPICVNKRDCQLWLKRFRKNLEPYYKSFTKETQPPRVRYFLVSEYGDRFGRPHYHVILFNYPHDSEVLRQDLKKSWNLCDPEWFDRGDTVQPVHPANINYVCKYCLGTLQDDDPLSKNFMLCSRKPGIGANFLTPQMIDYVRQRCDGTIKHHGLPMILPRFYESKIFNTDEWKGKLKTNRYFHQKDYLALIQKQFGVSEERAIRIYHAQQQEFDKKVKLKVKNGKNNVEKHFYNNRRQKAEAERLQRQALFSHCN